ncbi:FAD-dependent oxidoreductase [Verrucomicrobiota bacterium]
MKEPKDHAFSLKNPDQLRAEIKRLKLDIPIEEDFSLLGKELDIAGKTLPNRFCIQPMEGFDAQPDGSPGRLTYRRYIRYAQGGAGMIWLEASAVLDEARSNPAQLYLNKKNVGMFAELTAAIRKAAMDAFGRDIILIIQITHSGRYSRPDGTKRPIIAHHSPDLDSIHGISADQPLVTDDYLDNLQNAYVESARLAVEAGFNGVDVKSCHRCLISGLLAAFTREGRYGGSFENRTRFLLETLTAIKKNIPGLLIATRMNAYDAVRYPYGFGVDKDDWRKPDLSEPVKLAKKLKELGISIINVSTGIAHLGTDIGLSSDVGQADITNRNEHPLSVINRIMGITVKIQKAVPGVPVIGGDYSWLRQLIPYAAAGAVKRGRIAIVGLGRSALAYPDAVKDVLETGRMEPVKCCITCSACIQLMRDGGVTGCVIKDSDIYGTEYRSRRRFSLDYLKEEARRCHYCESAPCTEGCPSRIDVPAFIKAFAEDDIKKAYTILCRSNVLPEMCSHLCPTWMLCEGPCIESTLTGRPIPIRDIQYAVCWLAREQGFIKTSIPDKCSGKKVAIIGGGPAGISCAVKLVEKGHKAVIMERDKKPGGTPDSVIRAARFQEAQTEINAVLKSAFEAGRLEIEFLKTLGKDITLEGLGEYDAVLLAAGLWQERSLGKADGVIDALTFLKKVKSGELRSLPETVVVLSGGDCGMDAAAAAKELGAVNLYVVYGGSLSEMHWHMDVEWFRTSNTHCLTLTEPVGYETDGNGKLTGLKIRRTQLEPPDKSGVRYPVPVPNSESVLKADMVIEAMGLGISDKLKNALKGANFTDSGLIETAGKDSFAAGINGVFAVGALINGGASVAQCVSEGMKVAGEIDIFLSSGTKRMKE